MKKCISFLLLCLLLCVPGCALPPEEHAADTSVASLPKDSADVPVSFPAEAETEPIPAVPYTVQITRPDLMIYEGAGYDHFAAVLLDPGIYTITEEAVDSEGILWGKLKSGAGWIDLTKAAAVPESPVLLTAECLPKHVLPDEPYHEHTVSADRYAQRLLFQAYGTLTDIRFSSLSYDDGNMVPVGSEYTLAELTPEKPLFIAVSFPGDMTTYGISYTDTDGFRHSHMLYLSGRNGSLVMQEYTPAPPKDA